MPDAVRASIRSSVALRTASGSRRRSSPLSSIRSKAHMNTSASCRRYRTIEAGYAIAPARHSFPVNNAGPQAQTTERLDNERKTVSQIIPGPAVEPHPFAFLTSDDPEAVPFNFVQPNRTGRRIRGTGRKARRNEARRQCTRTQLRHARLDRKAWGRSRVDAALLPVGQELRFCLFYAGRAPARRDAEHRIDVHRDRPKPPQLGPAVPIFMDTPH